MNFEQKYNKYKSKYLDLKLNQSGGKKSKIKKLSRETYVKPNYVEHLSEPWFSLISLGKKTVEGRKNKGKFKEMKVGDIIEWTNDDFDHRSIFTKVTNKVEYSTFKEYLETEGLDVCLPGMPTLEHGLSVYFKYFTKEEESQYGVIAIHLELI